MTECFNGWQVDFQRNVHMYCHHLTASKGDLEVEVPCEDTPGGFVGIWPYDLIVDAAVYNGLLEALREWARTLGLNYRLYSTRVDFEENTRL